MARPPLIPTTNVRFLLHGIPTWLANISALSTMYDSRSKAGRISSFHSVVRRRLLKHSSIKTRASEAMAAWAKLLAPNTPSFSRTPSNLLQASTTTSGFTSLNMLRHSCDPVVTLSSLAPLSSPFALMHSSALQSWSTAPLTVSNPSDARMLPPPPQSSMTTTGSSGAITSSACRVSASDGSVGVNATAASTARL